MWKILLPFEEVAVSWWICVEVDLFRGGFVSSSCAFVVDLCGGEFAFVLGQLKYIGICLIKLGIHLLPVD